VSWNQCGMSSCNTKAMTPNELQRFEEKTAPGANGCILWHGCKIWNGYGHVRIGGRLRLAHRVAFEHSNGPIPFGLELDHLCRVRECVNPHHLRVVTRHENIMASGSLCLTKRNAEKVLCHRGHPLMGANLYRYPDGRRRCNQCRRDSASRRKEVCAASAAS
jgi:hypothetical protein